MQLGTQEEIDAQFIKVYEAEAEVMRAKLRLRALKGETLFQSGDSFGFQDALECMATLQNEFGARNLRAM
jgi:hypothetical protein